MERTALSAGDRQNGKRKMIQLVERDAVVRANAPENCGNPAAIEPSLIVLYPAFQDAIRESIVTGAAVEVTPDGLPLPTGDGQLGKFCDVALSGCPVGMEFSLLDGRRLYVSLNWMVNQKSAVVAVHATDVTEEKRREEAEAAQRCQREIDRMIEHSEAERQLRDSEERYRASFEQAAMGILHTSFQGRIIRCNREFGEMVGYSPEELAGRPFQEITLPGDQPPSRSFFERMISGELATASFEKRYVRKDGTLTWVNLTITTQRDSEVRPLHFMTMVQDINARKAAEQQLAVAQESLRKSEERYRTAFQMTMDAVALNRVSDGAYVDCNLAFQTMTMYRQDEVLGRTSLELGIWVDPLDRARMI